MTRFIVLTFGFLGWGYYELSGGADFVPEVATVEITEPAEAVVAQVVAPAVEPEVAQDIVARAETETLMTLAAAYEPQPAEETQPDIVDVIPEVAVQDMRSVAAERVNMRSGPGTGYRVLDTLPRGTEAEVLEVNADGWARVMIFQTGQEGWMAERLLGDS